MKIKWKNVDIAKYQGKIFDVVLYDGLFPDRVGQFKFMERASMFEAHDFYINDLPLKEQRKVVKFNH